MCDAAKDARFASSDESNETPDEKKARPASVYRVAVEHCKTHEITLWDVAAEAMSIAAGRGMQENDRCSSDSIRHFEVVSVWRLNIPLQDWKMKHQSR